jgi:hypothetical protein
MNLKVLFIITILISVFFVSADDDLIKISKNDYLEFKIGSYIQGFKGIENSIVIVNDSIRITLYYNNNRTYKKQAEQLKNLFEKTIPSLLENYLWAKKYKIEYIIDSEDRIDRGY